jgi:polyhydroxybutyrate depolymerase
MQFEGNTREYVLGKPKDYVASKTYPVVMSFHGDGGTGPYQAQALPFDLASQSEAILVYPTGIGATWTLYAADNADIRWIKALVDEVATKVNIDKTKVFGWGYSNGAYFLAQMTCREGNVFKAISSNAGGGPNDDQGEFEDILGIGKRYPSTCLDCPGGAIPALIIHGAGDNPAGGEFTARCIAETSGCQNNRTASAPSQCQQYNGCPTTNPVKWCEIPGLGHGVWAESMAESWKFFKAL